jgi:hypothetical protein
MLDRTQQSRRSKYPDRIDAIRRLAVGNLPDDGAAVEIERRDPPVRRLYECQTLDRHSTQSAASAPHVGCRRGNAANVREVALLNRKERGRATSPTSRSGHTTDACQDRMNRLPSLRPLDSTA